MTVVQRWGRWIADLRYEDVPERVVDLARLQLANVVASQHAGAPTLEGQAVLRAVLDRDPGGPCTLIPSGRSASVAGAVTANAALSMALDYDDYLYMGHTGHSAVVGSLALGQALGSCPRDVLLAQVIGNEIGGRVGASAVFGPQNGQAWSYLHAAAGAALAAKLLGLDGSQTAHALAIAMYQPTFTLWPGFMGPGSKLLTAAGPTVTGIEAAQYAQQGLTGALDVFEHAHKGFWAQLTWAPLPHMTGGLGRAWLTDTLAFKRYPGCAYIDTTMDALFDARDQYEVSTGRPLRASAVRSVDVRASLLSVEMDNLSDAHVGETLTAVNINFSIGLNVAIGLIAGRHTGAELLPCFLDEHAAGIRDLASRTELRHDWSLTLQVASAFDDALGAAGPLASLTPRQRVAALRGALRQVGGPKRTGLRPSGLLRHAPELLRRARQVRRHRHTAADLAAVDLTGFEMAFPAVVTLRTDAGEFSARQDIPVGAPGLPGREQAVRDKVDQEVRSASAEALWHQIQGFESGTVTALVEAASELSAA